MSRSLTRGIIHPHSPINWGHALNIGLTSWHLCLPGRGGGLTWRDLVGKYDGTLTNMSSSAWTPNGWGAFGSVVFGGSGSTDHVLFSNLPWGSSGTLIITAIWDGVNSFQYLCDASSGSRYLVYKNTFASNSWGLYLANTMVADSSGGLVDLMDAGQPTQIAVTWTATAQTVYKNGRYHNAYTASLSGGTSPANTYVGARFSAANEWAGTVSEFRVHAGTILTARQIADYYRLSQNGYGDIVRRFVTRLRHNVDTPTNTGLLEDLIAHWPLDELSGDALDVHGSQDLSATGSIGNSTAGWGTVRDLESSSSQYFSRNDNADLSTGDIDWSFSIWINTESITNSQTFASKWNTTGNQREWILQYSTSSVRWEFSSSNDGSTVDTLSNNSVAHANSTWFHLVIVHDATNNEKRLYVNNTKASKSYSSGVFDSTAQFRIGANQAFGQYHDGLASSASFWKKALSDDEVTELYNSGSPLPYDDYPDEGGGGGTANPWYYYQMLGMGG